MAPAGGGNLSTFKELCALATASARASQLPASGTVPEHPPGFDRPQDLGQPDLVYRFMQLANHQAALNSSRGAAFGCAEQLGVHRGCVGHLLVAQRTRTPPVHAATALLRACLCVTRTCPRTFRFASIAKVAGEQLAPHLERIIPRLYRSLHDPNGRVSVPSPGDCAFSAVPRCSPHKATPTTCCLALGFGRCATR